MQGLLNDLKDFTDKKSLMIKETKTNVMKFNTATNHDFPPELDIEGFGNNLEVVTEAKLFGVTVTNDLKWCSNTEKAFKKM